MEYINSLLIIASAFSVFGQYIDNTHRLEIQTIKNKLRVLDFKLADSNPSMAQVKEDWDNALACTCLGAKNFVKALFIYLVLIVLTVGVFSFIKACFEVDAATLTVANQWVIVMLSLVLLWVSISLGIRLRMMTIQKNNLSTEVTGVLSLYDTVLLAINEDPQKGA